VEVQRIAAAREPIMQAASRELWSYSNLLQPASRSRQLLLPMLVGQRCPTFCAASCAALGVSQLPPAGA